MASWPLRPPAPRVLRLAALPSPTLLACAMPCSGSTGRTSELLFGQYFSMFSEWYAESAEDGPMQMTGTPTARLPQIRFTQTFLQDWTVAGSDR